MSKNTDIQVINVIDQPDGSLLVEFNVTDKGYHSIKETCGWSEFSQEGFNQLVNNAVDYYIGNPPKEKPDGI